MGRIINKVKKIVGSFLCSSGARDEILELWDKIDPPKPKADIDLIGFGYHKTTSSFIAPSTFTDVTFTVPKRYWTSYNYKKIGKGEKMTKINMNTFAVAVAKRESGKKEINIAQIKEILKCAFQEFNAQYIPSQMLEVIERYEPEWEPRKGTNLIRRHR